MCGRAFYASMFGFCKMTGMPNDISVRASVLICHSFDLSTCRNLPFEHTAGLFVQMPRLVLVQLDTKTCLGMGMEWGRLCGGNGNQSLQSMNQDQKLFETAFEIANCCLFHYVNVSVLIKFSQKTSVFTLIIISSP